ncbi:MAG TPA: ABC transporter ATP-binding protein, partial [Thermodesulfovibrionia bacterium]|nr:ABC transporter ATP-binding protein [Thermodesulfovibrionia bacterium]
FPCTAGSRYGKEDIDATEQILRQMDIFHLQERPFYTLSGGEKQRVLLARTLNRNSTVVALDEPLTGIDIRHQQESVQYLKSIIREKLILVVIHDISVALATFNRFLFFINGVLAYDLKQDSINESVLFEVFGVRLNILKHENNMVVYL